MTETALSAAENMIAKGWSPLPIPRGSKAPNIKGWNDLRYQSVAEVRRAFSENDNIGIILGRASNGLVDIDLDCVEARFLADAFLPYTGMVHGRESSPSSHRWYLTDKELASKRYQDRSGQTLVEIRSTGGQTVIPPSVHPSGEVLEWVEEGSPPEVRRLVLKRSVGQLAAATLLVRHWPDEGSRHDATMALAGGLLRAGWKVANTWNFILEVGRAAGDEEASRRKGDVLTTARRMKKGKPVQGWPTLAKYLTQEVVDDVREWLAIKIEDVADDDSGPSDEIRNRRDVGEAILAGIPDPEWVVEKLLYAGKVHWVTGDPGAGKTLLMLKFSLDVMNAGGKVILIDEEAGLEMTADRVTRLGADPAVLSTHFLYHEFPALTNDEDDLERLFREVAREKPRLIIFDSAADLLQQSGISEDDNGEVTAWIKEVVEPLAHEYNAAVVVIDHVTKNRDQPGKWARGAGAKKAKAKVAWHVEKIQEFSLNPPTMGLVRLKKTKDTLGRLPERHDFRIGAKGDGRTVVETALTVVPSNEPMELEDSRIDRRLYTYLSSFSGGEQDARTPKHLADELRVKTKMVREACEKMHRDGDLEKTETDHGYAAYYVTSARVFDFSVDT